MLICESRQENAELKAEWLERYEYDGAEGWTYKTYPTKPLEQKAVQRVISSRVGGATLAEMQEY